MPQNPLRQRRWLRILRNPRALLTLLLVWGVWYGHEVYWARPKFVYMGVPTAQDWKQPQTWFRVLRNQGFMLGYSDLRGNPLWVSYALHPIPPNAPHYHRPSAFGTDWRGINRVNEETYRHSGFDRGHMAPNYAISRLYGHHAQLDSFLMTNITPQRPNLNRKLWQRLEALAVDRFALMFGTVWVLSGPVFSGSVERLPEGWNVEIPDAFYKILAAPPKTEGQAPLLLALLMPQQVRGNEDLRQFVVSVDRVEELTGLDFFKDLPDSVENQVEASTASEPWQLRQSAKLPAKY